MESINVCVYIRCLNLKFRNLVLSLAHYIWIVCYCLYIGVVNAFSTLSCPWKSYHHHYPVSYFHWVGSNITHRIWMYYLKERAKDILDDTLGTITLTWYSIEKYPWWPFGHFKDHCYKVLVLILISNYQVFRLLKTTTVMFIAALHAYQFLHDCSPYWFTCT